MEDTSIFILIVLSLVVLFLFCKYSKRSNFTFNNSDYQYSNPTIGREWNYYTCLDKECGGNTHDYDCLEKCHLKTYRKGMKGMDTKDWVCLPYADDENAYYRCLDSVYADYRYP